MHGNFPYMFDVWVNPVVHLLQCDQIGRVLKVLGTNFVTKVAKMFNNIFGLL